MYAYVDLLGMVDPQLSRNVHIVASYRSSASRPLPVLIPSSPALIARQVARWAEETDEMMREERRTYRSSSVGSLVPWGSGRGTPSPASLPARSASTLIIIVVYPMRSL